LTLRFSAARLTSCLVGFAALARHFGHPRQRAA
jgi:hypothetical protein